MQKNENIEEKNFDKIQDVKFCNWKLSGLEDTMEIEQVLKNEEFKQKDTLAIPKLIKDRINIPYSSVIFPSLQLVVVTDQNKLIFFSLSKNKVLYNLYIQYKNGVKLYKQRNYIWIMERGTSYETTRFSRIRVQKFFKMRREYLQITKLNYNEVYDIRCLQDIKNDKNVNIYNVFCKINRKYLHIAKKITVIVDVHSREIIKEKYEFDKTKYFSYSLSEILSSSVDSDNTSRTELDETEINFEEILTSSCPIFRNILADFKADFRFRRDPFSIVNLTRIIILKNKILMRPYFIIKSEICKNISYFRMKSGRILYIFKHLESYKRQSQNQDDYMMMQIINLTNNKILKKKFSVIKNFGRIKKAKNMFTRNSAYFDQIAIDAKKSKKIFITNSNYNALRQFPDYQHYTVDKHIHKFAKNNKSFLRGDHQEFDYLDVGSFCFEQDEKNKKVVMVKEDRIMNGRYKSELCVFKFCIYSTYPNLTEIDNLKDHYLIFTNNNGTRKPILMICKKQQNSLKEEYMVEEKLSDFNNFDIPNSNNQIISCEYQTQHDVIELIFHQNFNTIIFLHIQMNDSTKELKIKKTNTKSIKNIIRLQEGIDIGEADEEDYTSVLKIHWLKHLRNFLIISKYEHFSSFSFDESDHYYGFNIGNSLDVRRRVTLYSESGNSQAYYKYVELPEDMITIRFFDEEINRISFKIKDNDLKLHNKVNIRARRVIYCEDSKEIIALNYPKADGSGYGSLIKKLGTLVRKRRFFTIEKAENNLTRINLQNHSINYLSSPKLSRHYLKFSSRLNNCYQKTGILGHFCYSEEDDKDKYTLIQNLFDDQSNRTENNHNVSHNHNHHNANYEERSAYSHNSDTKLNYTWALKKNMIRKCMQINNNQIPKPRQIQLQGNCIKVNDSVAYRFGRVKHQQPANYEVDDGYYNVSESEIYDRVDYQVGNFKAAFEEKDSYLAIYNDYFNITKILKFDSESLKKQGYRIAHNFENSTIIADRFYIFAMVILDPLMDFFSLPNVIAYAALDTEKGKCSIIAYCGDFIGESERIVETSEEGQIMIKVQDQIKIVDLFKFFDGKK